jgi:2,3-bisphosphoglycerate-dependent phosphoglycerate mutase
LRSNALLHIKNMYRLVLLRHGQSLWNLENRFTGWMEVDLTEMGRQEAHQAAARLLAAGFTFDLAFTSVQQRAIETLEILLQEMQRTSIPVEQAWELNERHYGALQGLNKAETALRLGTRRVMDWRRSYASRPPGLEWDDHRHPRFDSRYAALPPDKLPRSESLKDTVERLLPCWQTRIAPAVRSGQQVLVVAHGNSLRALIQYLERIPEIQVPALNVPTGIPLIYELDVDLAPIRRYDLT